MSTYDVELLSSALFGKTRRALLGMFFAEPEKAFYVREIIRKVKAGQGPVQRELKVLHQAGILKRTVQGNQVYYQADSTCPIYPELEGLIRKTFGIVGVLQKALMPFSESIRSAFIFGSQASGTAKPGSDIDLMIIGRADALEVHRAILQAEKILNRPVNYTLLSPEEYSDKAREKGGFLQRVQDGKRLFVFGESLDV